jgi:hypothetical protein
LFFLPAAEGGEMTQEKKPWEPMKLTYVGDVGEIIQGGQGKTSTSADSGDVFKPPGQG